MRTITFRSVLIAVAAGFFLLGIASTILRPTARPPAESTSSPTEETGSTPAAETAQRSVLILGVDSLEAEPPELRAVWLASLRPPGRELFLLGLPIDRPSAEGLPLQDVFGYDDGPSSDFLEAFSTLTPLPIEAVVVLDTAGFSALIDFLGGIPTAGSVVDGRTALSVLDLLRADPAASLRAQYRLLQALSLQVGRIQPGTDLQPLVDLLPSHAYLSLPVQQVIAQVAPILPLEPKQIHVSLPVEDDPPVP